MADYRNAVLCKNGERLLELAVQGEARIKFVGAKTSSTRYEVSQLHSLTDIGEIRQSSGISASIKDSPNTVSLYTSFSNAKLSEGYYVRNIGIYAADPDDASGNTEILYAVVNADESVNPATYIPAYTAKGTSGVDITCEITVSNSNEVIIKLDETAGVPASAFDALAEQVNTTITEVDGKLSEVETVLIEADKKFTEFDTSIREVKNTCSTLTSNVTELKHDYAEIVTNVEEINADILELRNSNSESDNKYTTLETSVNEIKTEILAVKGTCSTLTSDVEELRSDCESVTARLVQMENNMNLQIQNIQKLISDHLVQAVHGGGGVHGLRYNNDLLQYQDADSWKTIESKYRTMTVRIDLSNRDPETCITYADDALLMTVGDSAWDAFFGHYPVLFKDGAEVGKLLATNYAKFLDGTNADITSGDSGDIMVAFPRRGLKITTTDNILTVSMTDDPDKDGYEYFAHTRGNTRKEKFYLGAYKGYVAYSKLRSLSGKNPTISQTIGTFREQAQANGAGYENSGFYQLTYRQAMYLLKYKNLNSQKTVGMGFVVDGTTTKVTGCTDDKGMDYGSAVTDGYTRMKLFGLEDFWGHVEEWIDGVVIDDAYHILTATTGFNDGGNNYTDCGIGTGFSSMMKAPIGNTFCGFLPRVSGAGTDTYFCDYAMLKASSVFRFGGSYTDFGYAGVFALQSLKATEKYRYISGRLMYL